MSPIKSYRRLFALTGPRYIVIAFLGRLPMAMAQLGTLLLVAGSTGSYGAGGISAGALAVANAVGSPIAAAIADRQGQRRVVLVQSLVGAAGLAALVILAGTGASWPLQVSAAAATGLLIPPVGPLARVRWRPLTHSTGPDQRRLVEAAFSYEGSADEASFVLGPALVGISVSLWHPAAALVVAAVLLAIFGSLFALDRSAEITHQHRHAAGTSAKTTLFTHGLIILCFAQLAVGMIFGSAQTGTSVLATNAGRPGLTGLLHALLGVGSVIAGLAVGALPHTFGYHQRIRVFAAALLVLSLPLLWVNSLGALAAALGLLGFAVAPYMISVFTLAERITPIQRTGAAMTVLAGTTGFGYAVGSSVAGRLADWGGHTPAFAVTVSAGALATILALAAGATLRKAQLAATVHAEPVAT